MSSITEKDAELIRDAVRSTQKVVSLSDHRKKLAKKRQAEQQNEQLNRRRACS
ncbi:MAG: hypothetical protein ABIO57_03635 [Candidatus Paceibacterota bacterium]